jgi:hypothetical protein
MVCVSLSYTLAVCVMLYVGQGFCLLLERNMIDVVYPFLCHKNDYFFFELNILISSVYMSWYRKKVFL